MNAELMKKYVDEIHVALQAIDGQRQHIKDILQVAKDEHNINKALLRKLAKVYHDGTFAREQSSFNAFETAYQQVIGSESV